MLATLHFLVNVTVCFRRSNRTKRKQERKAGRKGTVDEEKYLLQSLVKLSARISGLQGKIGTLFIG